MVACGGVHLFGVQPEPVAELGERSDELVGLGRASGLDRVNRAALPLAASSESADAISASRPSTACWPGLEPSDDATEILCTF